MLQLRLLRLLARCPAVATPAGAAAVRLLLHTALHTSACLPISLRSPLPALPSLAGLFTPYVTIARSRSTGTVAQAGGELLPASHSQLALLLHRRCRSASCRALTVSLNHDIPAGGSGDRERESNASMHSDLLALGR